MVQYLKVALESETPDQRREAVNQVVQSRYAHHNVVATALDAVARTDGSVAVRCAAVRGLRKADSKAAAYTYAAILDPKQSEEQSRPAPAEVRLDALRGTLGLVEVGEVPEDLRDDLLSLSLDLLDHDRSRDIRQTAARVLGYFPDGLTLDRLINSLDQRDFGVVYEIEHSLMRLTGQTHDHDSVAWRAWLESADDPFADAGKLDHLLIETHEGWWHRSYKSMKRTFYGYLPKKKDS